MDIKLIQSKINLLEAQAKQLSECGFFTEKEIERLLQPLNLQLAQLYGQKSAVESNEEFKGVNNIEVNL